MTALIVVAAIGTVLIVHIGAVALFRSSDRLADQDASDGPPAGDVVNLPVHFSDVANGAQPYHGER